MPYSRNQLVAALYTEADSRGIDRGVAYRQIDQESRFNPNAVSPAGAQGIAQFMPATARAYGLRDPFDPISSFWAWGAYMSYLLTLFGGDYAKALAGYNWGEGRVQKAARTYGAAWLSHTPTETRNYVGKILGNAAPAPSPSPPDDSDGDGYFNTAGDLPADDLDLSADTDLSISPLLLAGGVALLAIVLLTSD